MGLHPSKHINITSIPETSSSREFKLQRRLHYKNEFAVAKISLQNFEIENLSERSEQTIPEGTKRPTFLEPPNLHDEQSKDLFRKKSIKSEVDEFTYAKECLARKKSKSHIDKSVNLENRKIKKKKHRHTIKRNRSHEPPEA